MKKFNLALIADSLFYTLCAFLISFAALRYFFKSLYAALIVSAAIAACVCVAVLFFLLKRREKRLLLTLDEGSKKSLALHLSVCGEKELNQLFTNAIDGAYVAGNCVETENKRYYFNFKMSALSADDVALVIRERGDKSAEIFCNTAGAEALALAEDFSVRVRGVAEIYVLLKEKSLLPEKYALGEVKKPNIFKKIKKRFTRKRCPALFFSGLTLLMFSFFTFYPVWYIATGSVLMALSAVCLFIPQSDIKA